ncbi:hypothetical protein K488DRAFT_91938 [Vararia minispora EC-137]|uniref:Uncharacterized protein n=1 Tax=Vararia minispora EC-137 TaxID=1314806 RepID=A0ACB8Q508_9AGAM|nr:hypothetical protein K488DRAFT_91938 [Vararia minispora EC-137]
MSQGASQGLSLGPALQVSRLVVHDDRRVCLTETNALLKNDLAKANNTIMGLVEDISKQYERTPEWVRLQVGIGALKSVNSRLPSAWSIFCSDKLAETNEGLPKGFRNMLPQFLKAHTSELKEEFDKVGDEEKEELVSACQDLASNGPRAART